MPTRRYRKVPWLPLVAGGATLILALSAAWLVIERLFFLHSDHELVRRLTVLHGVVSGAALLAWGALFVLRDRRRQEANLEAIVAERTRQLAAQERRFEDVVESACEAVVLGDGQARITYFNRTAERMFGWSRDDVLGRHASLLMAEAHRGRADRIVTHYAETGEVLDGATPVDLEGVRKDGTTFPIQVTRSVFTRDGAPEFMGVIRDMTAHRQLATRMREMDRMIAVGTLAAGVGHEINNPLAYIVANLDFVDGEFDTVAAVLAARGPADPLVPRIAQARQALADLGQGVDRVRAVVRDLRTLSQADGERREPIRVERALEAALHMASVEIRHRARLVQELGATPPVVADESRLGQVFLNLLVNAAHAIPEGRADANEIRVRTFVDGGRVAVEVTDSGAGIAPEHRARIFDPFFTTKPVGQGTGLGLAISRGIVHGLGGEIQLDSQVGRGTTFRVLLPAATGGAAVEAAPAPAPPAPVRRGARILVVDDDALVCAALRRILGADHDVDVCLCARQALSRLANGAFYDVVLCDVMMPVMSGKDFHAEVAHAFPALARRMVFVTGGAFTPEARGFLDAIPNRRLDKPFDPDTVRAAVEATLAQHAAS